MTSTERMIEKAAEHGRREGAADYRSRAAEVALGSEEPEWAWPYVAGDDAYLSAVGSDKICEEIGIDEDAWEEIADAWCDAFRAGYEAAHGESAVTDSDIRELRSNAGEAGDLVQVHACSVALGDEEPVTESREYEERYGGSGMDAAERATIMRIDSAATARQLCERAILDARARAQHEVA